LFQQWYNIQTKSEIFRKNIILLPYDNKIKKLKFFSQNAPPTDEKRRFRLFLNRQTSKEIKAKTPLTKCSENINLRGSSTLYFTKIATKIPV
jgi:hypothetical protein